MASRPVSILELVTLREYAPLDSLLRLLPKKAQKALALNAVPIDVEWTCVDATSEFIVLGSNISLVYLFDRQEQQLAKFRCEDKSCQVTCVKLLTCLDHQLAIGTSTGHVEIYLLPSRSQVHAVQAKKFVLENLHQSNPVSCIEWSNNGMKFFSGDALGKVIQTDVDFYESRCQASCVATEEEAIVQLSYAHKKLVISTMSRTVVCTPGDGDTMTQVGQQPRKSRVLDALPKESSCLLSRGGFGAHFVPGMCKPSDATAYVSRPGWRLWHASVDGRVLETIMFKDLVARKHPSINLLPDTPPDVMPPPMDLQLGVLHPFSHGLLVSWSQSSVVILQPFGPEGALVVASNFGELGTVVSLAVTRHEIFVLRKGCERCLIRIATAPEMQLSKEPAKSERDYGKIQTTKLSLVGDSATKMELAPSAPILKDRITSTKLKNKFNSMRGFLSKAAEDISDKAMETKNKMEKNMERSFKLNLPIPERRSSEGNISIQSDRSSVSMDERSSSTDPGTPEAMLSERLMVSVINAGSMSGDQSPSAGGTSPTAPFRSPAHSFSTPTEQDKATALFNGVVQGAADKLAEEGIPEAEEATEAESVPEEEKETMAQVTETETNSDDIPKDSLTSSIEVTAMSSSKHKPGRISVVITEDPSEDQSAHVVENLSKRHSAAFKISQDTLQNIGTDFSDSIVFENKPKSKTKRKKKTVKGNKHEAAIAEIGQEPTRTDPAGFDRDQEGSDMKAGSGLRSILEGEAGEEISFGQQTDNGGVKTTVTSTFSESNIRQPSSEVNWTNKVLGPQGNLATNFSSETGGSPIPSAIKNSCEELSTTASSVYSLPRSLKSAPVDMTKSKNEVACDSVTDTRKGYLYSDPAQEMMSFTEEQSDVAPSKRNGNGLKVADGKPLSISLPRSLHSNDLPTNEDGELSPLVSPRSPKSPRGLEDEEGRQTRRLGVIMEDFDLDTVPEEAKQPSPATSPNPREGKDVPQMPFIPPRKKNNRLGAVAALRAAESRPVSEFEDIYSQYRRTVLFMKESIHEEPPPLPINVDKEDLKEASNSDNSETESHESDEGEEAEATLPESIQQKLAGSWMQCSTPNYIFQLVASERHIWYVDSRYKVHHSLATDITNRWSKLKEAPSMQLAVSPSGGIVWRVHPKTGHACSSTAITQRSPVGYRWIEASKDVAHLCVDENTAWIIKQNGQLCVHKGISASKPYTRETLIESNVRVMQIAANNYVVWARTVADKVVYREGITLKRPQGQRWVELPDEETRNLRMVSIALDSRNTGWAIDGSGTVWFRTGVTKDKPTGDDQKWWQVCMSEYLMEDPNVLRMMVNMAGTAAKVDRVVNWLKKQCYKATAIAANSAGVWVCSSYHYKTTLHVSRGNLLGSRWEVSSPVGLAASATWKCVCAATSYGPSGMIWALQTSGEIFCYSPENRKPTMVQSPDGVCFEHISATTHAMWALSTQNEIYVRQDISDRCLGGGKWKRLNVSQFGNRQIVHFTMGDDVVWAVDSSGGIHFRLGVTLPKFDALPLAWVPVDGRPVGYSVYFTHVFCSPGSNAVWAIDNKKTVYARVGVAPNMPVGLGWEPVEGTQANMLCMSADSVWALCPNGELACRFGISSDNATGDYWKKIPGNFRYLTASQNDELWTIDNDGRLFHRLTKMFIRSATTKAAAMETGLAQGDDDWELL